MTTVVIQNRGQIYDLFQKHGQPPCPDCDSTDVYKYGGWQTDMHYVSVDRNDHVDTYQCGMCNQQFHFAYNHGNKQGEYRDPKHPSTLQLRASVPFRSS